METLAQAVVLHLHIRVREGNEAKLTEFLHRARPYYEAPGGIRVRLIEDADDPRCFIEIIEYESEAVFEQDHLRLDADSTMESYLDEWHSLLEGEVRVKKYLDRSVKIGG